jgi:hypothetical protein
MLHKHIFHWLHRRTFRSFHPPRRKESRFSLSFPWRPPQPMPPPVIARRWSSLARRSPAKWIDPAMLFPSSKSKSFQSLGFRPVSHVRRRHRRDGARTADPGAAGITEAEHRGVPSARAPPPRPGGRRCRRAPTPRASRPRRLPAPEPRERLAV